MSDYRYKRYHIETAIAKNLFPYPNRFRVKIRKHRLLLLLLKEFFHYKGNTKVVTSSPCVYGVFSGPVGGLAPREHLCVGCLRCTTQHPDIARIEINPEFQKLGDSYLSFEAFDTIVQEASSGMVPVKGAGYRGKFGGTGWDGMWTDMSEIVRPTRDGIHGREFISTVVDIGSKPRFLAFDHNNKLSVEFSSVISLPLPMIFDVLPEEAYQSQLAPVLAETANELENLAVFPVSQIKKHNLQGSAVAPLVRLEEFEEFLQLPWEPAPAFIELDFWHQDKWQKIQEKFPQSILCLRMQFHEDIVKYVEKGVRVFHLCANYHGLTEKDELVMDAIRRVHQTLIEAKVREEVTLIGSGGIVAAEHVPKAIICGLDLVALDTPLCVAMQGEFEGECVSREQAHITYPKAFPAAWGKQRLKNLMAAWRDQLLEILGAMGLREVRRLRGEIGRAMFQADLEREAFGDITGYEE